MPTVASAFVDLNESREELNEKLTSEVMFCGKKMLVIKHAGEEYQLRLTNQNKLILTK
ncbi:MAG: Hemin uptake protein hemP [Pseudomonadota bacterium]|jgi:hemin uptake protein HemP